MYKALYCHVSSTNKHKKVDHIDKSYDKSSTCLRCGQIFTLGGNQTFPLRSKITTQNVIWKIGRGVPDSIY
jgi:hypothetical protein